MLYMFRSWNCPKVGETSVFKEFFGIEEEVKVGITFGSF